MMKAIGRKNEGKPRDTDEVMEAQPLIVHLMALRKVIIICLAAVVIFFLIVFFKMYFPCYQKVFFPELSCLILFKTSD